ncbi:MAG: DMT family transporter [Promethearchaeota archaeon]
MKEQEKTARERLNKAKISMFFSCVFMGTIGFYVHALPNPVTAACMRGLSSFFFISIYFILQKKTRYTLQLLKPVWKYMLVEGINIVLLQLFYFNGMNSGYAMAAFMLYTGGLFALIFNRFILKERISLLKWSSFILAVIGVCIMVEPWKLGNSSVFDIWGPIYGLLSGITLALSILIKKLTYRKMNIINPSYKNNVDFYLSIVYIRVFFLGFILLPFSFSYIFTFSGIQWIAAVFIGFLPGAVAFFLYNYGLKEDKGGNIIILSYIEPLVACMVNIILLAELSPGIILGGILIIGANIIVFLSDRRLNNKDLQVKRF